METPSASPNRFAQLVRRDAAHLRSAVQVSDARQSFQSLLATSSAEDGVVVTKETVRQVFRAMAEDEEFLEMFMKSLD